MLNSATCDTTKYTLISSYCVILFHKYKIQYYLKFIKIKILIIFIYINSINNSAINLVLLVKY